MNATKYTEKQTVLIKKQNIFKSLGLTGLLQSTSNQMEESPLKSQIELTEIIGEDSFDHSKMEDDQNTTLQTQQDLLQQGNYNACLKDTFYCKSHSTKQQYLQKRDTLDLEK